MESGVRVANRAMTPRHVRRRIAENMVGVLLRVGQVNCAAWRESPSQAGCYEKRTPATRNVRSCQRMAGEGSSMHDQTRDSVDR